MLSAVHSAPRAITSSRARSAFSMNRRRIGLRTAIASAAVVKSIAMITASLETQPARERLDGFRAALLYRRREEQGTTRWSNEVRSSLVGYLHLPGLGGFAHHVVAARVAAGVLDGTLPQRYGVGGVATGGLSVGYGQTLGSERIFPVRGYWASELRGRRALTTSLEYRIPLALIGQSLGHLPVGADKLSLSLFGDTGDAWDPGAKPQPTRLASVGAELVGDLTIVYDAPLRLRLGVAAPLTAPPSGAPQQPQAYVAVGFTF